MVRILRQIKTLEWTNRLCRIGLRSGSPLAGADAPGQFTINPRLSRERRPRREVSSRWHAANWGGWPRIPRTWVRGAFATPASAAIQTKPSPSANACLSSAAIGGAGLAASPTGRCTQSARCSARVARPCSSAAPVTATRLVTCAPGTVGGWGWARRMPGHDGAVMARADGTREAPRASAPYRRRRGACARQTAPGAVKVRHGLEITPPGAISGGQAAS